MMRIDLVFSTYISFIKSITLIYSLQLSVSSTSPSSSLLFDSNWGLSSVSISSSSISINSPPGSFRDLYRRDFHYILLRRFFTWCWCLRVNLFRKLYNRFSFYFEHYPLVGLTTFLTRICCIIYLNYLDGKDK